MASECQRTFIALLRTYERASAVVFVRELSLFADEHAVKDTPCAGYLADMRKIYRNNIGEDALSRIVAFEETRKDEIRARQATWHLRDDTVEALTKRMTWSSYLFK